MKKTVILCMLIGRIFSTYAAGLTCNEAYKADLNYISCQGGKYSYTVKFGVSAWEGSSQDATYQFGIFVKPQNVTNPPTITASKSSITVGTETRYGNDGKISTYSQGDEIAVTFEVDMPEFDLNDKLTWDLYYGIPGNNSQRVDFTLSFGYTPDCNDLNLGVGGQTYFFIDRLNDDMMYYNKSFINLGETNTAHAKLSGFDDNGDPAFVETQWNWEVVLLSTDGENLILSDATYGATSTEWTFDMISEGNLPNKEWLRDDEGHTRGYFRMYVDEDGYHKELTQEIFIKNRTNAPKVSTYINNYNTCLFSFYTVGATKYDLRYKKTSEGTWTEYTDLIYSTYQEVLSANGDEYEVQVRAYNETGVSEWGETNFYTPITIPFTISDKNIDYNVFWDINGGDGADRAYMFKLPYQTKIIISTAFGDTDFDTKLEIFDENKISTGFYNDDDYNLGVLTSTIEATLDAGVYYVVVDGYNGEEGNFDLSFEVDETIYTLPFDISSSNVGESNDFDVNGSDGADKAYKFHLANDAYLDISTCFPNTDYDTKVEVFNLDNTTTGLYNDDGDCDGNYLASTISGGYLAAGTYYLVVDGYGNSEGDFVVEVKEAVTMKSSSIGSQGVVYEYMSDI
nr:fibronectin type III domain-containing protein [Bacteroidales bacterium]